MVPPNTKLPPHTRLSAAKYDWDDRPLKDSRQAEEKASDFEKSLGPRAWLYTNHTAEEKGSLWQEEGEDEDAEDTDGGGEGGGSGSPVAAAREAAELQHLPAVLRRDVVRRRAILRKGILTVNSLAPSLEAKQLCEHKDPLVGCPSLFSIFYFHLLSFLYILGFVFLEMGFSDILSLCYDE